MRPRLKDVAALAGVSLQTVSNVVNSNAGEMSVQTRQRVQDAMRELNYHPNSQARGLRYQRTNTLAFLLLDPDPLYLADRMTDLIISGVGAVARERGFMVLVHAAQPDQLDHSLFAPIQQNRADGALLMLSGERQMRLRYIDEMKSLTPNFVVFEDVDDDSVASVTADNRHGSYVMTRHLLESGHRRIAFIGSRIPWPMIEQRLAGYREALTDSGVLFDPTLTRFEGEWHADTGHRLMTELRTAANPPTAVLAGNDLLAIGAVKALKQLGLRVPQDCAVVGFDDFDFAEHTDPALTTVRVPGFEMGHRAATKLIDRIEGKDHEPHTITLPVEPVIRASA